MKTLQQMLSLEFSKIFRTTFLRSPDDCFCSLIDFLTVMINGNLYYAFFSSSGLFTVISKHTYSDD